MVGYDVTANSHVSEVVLILLKDLDTYPNSCHNNIESTSCACLADMRHQAA